MSKRWNLIGIRLAFALPFTPWPVLMWIAGSPHGAGALYAGTNLALLSCLVTLVIGLVLIFRARAATSTASVWMFVMVLNEVALTTYIGVKTWPYL